MKHSILILGGGHMGGAMAKRLRAQQHAVTVIEPDAARRANLEAEGIACHAALSPTSAEVVVLAVKPQQFHALAPEVKAAISGGAPLLLSIMAGVPLAALHSITHRAVRVMPNLPATIGESMSVLCAPALDAAARATAESICAAIGKTAWVEDESQLHAVTAISGSGPAYLYALMEAMENAALQHGLDAALARSLVTQTMRGAALLASASPQPASALRAQVTSKGGTTEAALAAFAEGGLEKLVAEAISAAAERSHILSK